MILGMCKEIHCSIVCGSKEKKNNLNCLLVREWINKLLYFYVTIQMNELDLHVPTWVHIE